jgi:hypothetical protein
VSLAALQIISVAAVAVETDCANAGTACDYVAACYILTCHVTLS